MRRLLIIWSFRDYKNDPDEDHFEFYFDDDNQGNNLKRYFSNDNEAQRYQMDYDDVSIFIPNYKAGDIIKITDANERFGFTHEDFLSQVNVVKDTVNNLTKLSVDNGSVQVTNLVVVEGIHDVQGYGLGYGLNNFYLSFGDSETVGTSGDDHWMGNSAISNTYDGMDGNDRITGGLGDDVLSGGSGDDKIYALDRK